MIVAWILNLFLAFLVQHWYVVTLALPVIYGLGWLAERRVEAGKADDKTQVSFIWKMTYWLNAPLFIAAALVLFVSAICALVGLYDISTAPSYAAYWPFATLGVLVSVLVLGLIMVLKLKSKVLRYLAIAVLALSGLANYVAAGWTCVRFFLDLG